MIPFRHFIRHLCYRALMQCLLLLKLRGNFYNCRLRSLVGDDGARQEDAEECISAVTFSLYCLILGALLVLYNVFLLFRSLCTYFHNQLYSWNVCHPIVDIFFIKSSLRAERTLCCVCSRIKMKSSSMLLNSEELVSSSLLKPC